MADALKNQYGPEVPAVLSEKIGAVWPAFDHDRFLELALADYDTLELMDRGRHMAAALQQVLPADYGKAIDIILASLDSPLNDDRSFAMGAFFYLPHTCFVAAFGLDDFDTSMRAMYQLTRRFTAEFCIRPFLERYPQQTLQQLAQWANDDNLHVRRLVSEGTRPRLPWAPRLPAFIADPAPVLALLEQLRDDPELYVRRSVANNLNDIGKDHPAILNQVAAAWMIDASEQRQWLIRHALRSAVKRGDPQALAVLGFDDSGHDLLIEACSVTPARLQEGGAVTLNVTVRNPADSERAAVIDYQVHYVKADGKTRPKVFKIREVTLAPGAELTLARTLSVAPMTTRKHYPGRHRVELLVNGQVRPLGEFELL